jgi:hypothetical protein
MVGALTGAVHIILQNQMNFLFHAILDLVYLVLLLALVLNGNSFVHNIIFRQVAVQKKRVALKYKNHLQNKKNCCIIYKNN